MQDADESDSDSNEGQREKGEGDELAHLGAPVSDE